MHLKAKKLHLYLKFSCNRNFTFLTQKYFGKRFSNDLCLVNENEKQFFQILKIHFLSKFFGWKHKIVCHEFLTLPPRLQPKVRYILHKYLDACWHRVWCVLKSLDAIFVVTKQSFRQSPAGQEIYIIWNYFFNYFLYNVLSYI